MSHPSQPSPDDNTSPIGDAELKLAMQETEYLVQHLEPKVRELNRRYRDLLGAHPESSDGNWVYLARDENGEFVFAFETISVGKINLHAARVGETSDYLDDSLLSDNSDFRDADDIGAVIVGEAASLTTVPRTHVRLERYS